MNSFYGDIPGAVYELAKYAIPELKPVGYDPDHELPNLMCDMRDSALTLGSTLRIWIAQGIGMAAKIKYVEVYFTVQDLRLYDKGTICDRIDSALMLLRAYWFGSKPAGKYRKFRSSR